MNVKVAPGRKYMYRFFTFDGITCLVVFFFYKEFLVTGNIGDMS
mgnify:CR=1 FL=1